MSLHLGKNKNIALFTAIILVISFFVNGVFANGTVSVNSPELLKGYSLYTDLTDMTYPLEIQYGDGIADTLKKAAVNCSANKATNVGNNGEEFYFSDCGYPDITNTSFTANNNLLNLEQAGNETIRSDITNKAKFGIYSKLFLALKYSYAYNNGYTLYEKDNTKLSQLNFSYSNSAESLEKSIPEAFLITQSGAYTINAMDYLWKMPEIATKHYYSTDQYNRYKKFETNVLTVMKKVQVIKNKSTLSKLETALLKVLKNSKGKTDNDKYLMFMIIYEMVLEQLGK